MVNAYTANSICGMCTARCPIQVHVHDGKAQWIHGHMESSLKGALCAKGAAGIALEEGERPRTPLLRVGPRGSGQWREATWEEALQHVANELQKSQALHGQQSVLWSDRSGPFTDLYRAFMRGLGSSNICSHSVSCDINVHHAGKAVLGWGREGTVFDFANCKHLVLQSRNLFEALAVAEARTVGKALQQGCQLTVIDIRTSITSAKANTFICPRPGTDYALNLGIIHTLLTEGLFQKDFVAQHCTGLEELAAFVQPYSAAWAAAEAEVSEQAILDLARSIAKAAPHVIWHPGWMTSRYADSFLVSQSAFIITALLGGIGVKGGMVPANSAKSVGRVPLQRLAALYPQPEQQRADGIGTEYAAFDPDKGLLHKMLEAMKPGPRVPIKSYIAWRHDPIQSMPDPAAVKACLDNLDLLVAVSFSWSEVSHYADVVLPLSTYLTRESIVAHKGGLSPQFFVRQKALERTDNTRADWEIISGLARHMGLDKLAFSSIEAIWDYQLQGTGVNMADFAKNGSVSLCSGAVYPEPGSLSFGTPSGKIELSAAGWGEKTGLASLVPYQSPKRPPANAFRIIFGRTAVHTQGHTMNNPLLAEQMPENLAWIHPTKAEALGLAAGQRVEVLNARGESAGSLPVFITEGIHPEAVFMVHGFGQKHPKELLSFNKGAADNELLSHGLANHDPRGGGLAMQEHFVTLRKVEGL